MEFPTNDQVIAHIQKNERDFLVVSLDYAMETWWVQFIKGDVKYSPAVHTNLADAYAMALAHFEKATEKSP